jgi:hypothetical protein
VQGILGTGLRDMYLAGYWNLTDHLDAAEAAWLARWLDSWGPATVATFTLDHLWLLAARDDLVLDAEVREVISLT